MRGAGGPAFSPGGGPRVAGVDDRSVTDFLVDQARGSEHVTTLVLLLIKKGLITGPEYEAALQTAVSARVLDRDQSYVEANGRMLHEE
jgi:hypothetical protein